VAGRAPKVASKLPPYRRGRASVEDAMNTLILAFPGAEELGRHLAARLRCECSAVALHRFPDGEQGVRLPVDVSGCRVLFAAPLDHPDERTLPVLFAADAAREIGAAEVGLVAPYLPYMRQDARFQPGEAITARSYARLLSRAFDFLVTVGPHLHRVHALQEIYPIPTRVVSPARAIARWLARELPHCILVGTENATWIGEVAAAAGAPFVLMERQGEGRRPALPPGSSSQGRAPVVMDDIATTGQALIAAAQAVHAAGWSAPTAVVVHALLQEEDVQALHHAGVPRIASCNTIAHAASVIPVDDELADAVAEAVQA
jgi:ribose-phosphate pyrophosphokinase